MVNDQAIRAQAGQAAGVVRGRVRREQSAYRDRQPALYAERGRQADAGKEGPAAAGPAVFQAAAKVRSRCRCRPARWLEQMPMRLNYGLVSRAKAPCDSPAEDREGKDL